MQQNTREIALNPRKYIKFWFEARQLSARDAVKCAQTFNTLWLDYLEFFPKLRAIDPDNRSKPISEVNMLHAYKEYIPEQLAAGLKTAFDGLECKVPSLNLILTWIKAVTGATDPKDVNVIAHWIWTVKRKGFDRPVKHQIMPVLYGPQGGGKSRSLENLIKPIENFRLTIGMNQLDDERIYDSLSNNFVILFDELQGVERADMNALKRQITSTHNSYRKLYGHEVLIVPMRCGFIGATNKPIAESFSDSTGMRRFWELNCQSKIDWEAVNNIDYTELWKGVDESLEDGYLTGDALQQVLEKQQDLVNKDDIEEFLLDNIMWSKGESLTLEIGSAELFEEYIHWTGTGRNTYKHNRQQFVRRLKKFLPWQPNRIGHTGRRETFFNISSKSVLTVRPKHPNLSPEVL